ncbi:MAG: extracellular solute-binding protein [Halanaerobiales bacterium]
MKRVFVLVLALGILMAASLTGFAAQYDLGGATVNYVTFVTHVFDDFPEIQERMAMAEEKFNCKINIVRSSWGQEEADQMKRLLSGESQYDIWRVETANIYRLAAQNILYPLDQVLSEDYFNSLPDLSKEIIEATKYKGHIYGMGASDYSTAIDNMYFIAYNKDMFDEAGLPDPYEQYKAGTWDWNAFEIALDTLTADLDGDGEIDRWGIDIITTEALVISNGGNFTTVDERGKVIYTGDSDRVIEALEKKTEWENKGYTRGWGDFFIQGITGMFDAPIWQTRDKADVIDFEWGLVPYPKGPGSPDYAYPLRVFNLYALPVNSAAPEALVALHDFIWPPETAYDRYLDELMSQYPTREMYGVIMDAAENWTNDDILLYLEYLDIWSELDKIYRGEVNAASHMSAIRPQVQARLDELFNN